MNEYELDTYVFFYFKTNNFQMKPLQSKSDLRIPTTRKHLKINF